jgi:hypothetical protein
MYVALRQRGGFLGLDRKIEVEDGTVSVTENGLKTKVQDLDASKTSQITELATAVLEKSSEIAPRSGSLASDSMETAIEIAAGSKRKVLSVNSGDRAPGELWELVGELSAASAPPSPTSSS